MSKLIKLYAVTHEMVESRRYCFSEKEARALIEPMRHELNEKFSHKKKLYKSLAKIELHKVYFDPKDKDQLLTLIRFTPRLAFFGRGRKQQLLERFALKK